METFETWNLRLIFDRQFRRFDFFPPRGDVVDFGVRRDGIPAWPCGRRCLRRQYASQTYRRGTRSLRFLKHRRPGDFRHSHEFQIKLPGRGELGERDIHLHVIDAEDFSFGSLIDSNHRAGEFKRKSTLFALPAPRLFSTPLFFPVCPAWHDAPPVTEPSPHTLPNRPPSPITIPPPPPDIPTQSPITQSRYQSRPPPTTKPRRRRPPPATPPPPPRPPPHPPRPPPPPTPTPTHPPMRKERRHADPSHWSVRRLRVFEHAEQIRAIF